MTPEDKKYEIKKHTHQANQSDVSQARKAGSIGKRQKKA